MPETNMKIWMLTHGGHSDYGVTALYDDDHKAEAEKAEKLTGGEVQGPLILNHFDVDEPPLNLKCIRVEMFRNGDTGSVWEDTPLDDEGKVRKPHYGIHGLEGKEWKGRWRLFANVFAKDKQHAVKIVNEIRTRIIAGDLPESGYI